jgi:hypothetical protein
MAIEGLVDTVTGAAVDPETRYEPARAAASKAEMEAGTEAGLRAMSPLRVAEAIAALAVGGGGAGSQLTITEASSIGGDMICEFGEYTSF